MTYVNSTNYGSSTPPANPGDTVNPNDPNTFPYDPNGQTPTSIWDSINWNDPKSIAAGYENLLSYLHSEGAGDYNGYIMLVQMTMKISSLPSNQQSAIASSLNCNSLQSFFQAVVNAAIIGADVQNGMANNTNGEQAGLSFANSLLQALQGAGLTQNPVIQSMIQQTQSMINGGLDSWLKSHTEQIPTDGSPITVFLDNNGHIVTNFTEFTQGLTASAGTLINGSNNNTTDDYDMFLDEVYGAEIQQLEQTCKDPMELIMLLLSLINQRDQDNGRAANGYGNNLKTLSTADGYITQMLDGLQANPPDMQTFYGAMNNLQTLIANNPNFAQMNPQITQVLNIINGETAQVSASDIPETWQIQGGEIDVADLPPGSHIDFISSDGKTSISDIQYDAATKTLTYKDSAFPPNTYTITNSNGEISLPAGQVTVKDLPGLANYTFGQLAGLGLYNVIGSALQKDGSSSTEMSDITNVATSLQSIVNSPSQAINMEMQTTTQNMQTTESFEEQVIKMVTQLNAQIVSNTATQS